jgi:hypothetical protein
VCWGESSRTRATEALLSESRKALQNTRHRLLRQTHFVDTVYTLDYYSRFLADGVTRSATGGVAQLGERLNGIQEVRGSIPLASIPAAAVPRRGGTTLESQDWSATRPSVASHAGIAQLVEHNLAKVGVAGSSPVSRSGGGCACFARASQAASTAIHALVIEVRAVSSVG